MSKVSTHRQVERSALGVVLALICVGAGCSADERSHEAAVSAQTRGDSPQSSRGDSRQTAIFWVDGVHNRIWRADVESDLSDRQLLARGPTGDAPAGIAVDAADGCIYWTNQDALASDEGGGSLQRMKLDDASVEMVVAYGVTKAPSQINIDEQARKLYWSDRDGLVWRAGLDGSSPEVLLRGHELQQPAGIGIDVAERQIYISDRVARRLYRIGFDLPKGETAETRSDVEVIARLPASEWPLHLALDQEDRKIYWTDRADGTIYAMNMDIPADATAEDRTDIKPVVSGLTEPVGIAIDVVTKHLYFTELSDRISRSNLDGSELKTFPTIGSASAIALAHLPN